MKGEERSGNNSQGKNDQSPMKVIKMKNKDRDGEVRETELGRLYKTWIHFISVDSIEIFFRIFVFALLEFAEYK